MSAKIFFKILKTYMTLYIIAKFRNSSFLNHKLSRQAVLPPSPKKRGSKTGPRVN